MALCNAKRDMFIEEGETVDPRDLMNAESSKWQRVSEEVMKCGFSPCPRDAAACKMKWTQIVPEYKRIADFFARSGINGADYWNLTVPERRKEGLPRSFPKDQFYSLHEWYGTRPSMQPPHTRDLLFHEDGNYSSFRPPAAVTEDLADTDQENEDPMDIAAEVEGSGDTSTKTPSAFQGQTTGSRSTAPKFEKRTARSGRERPVLPAGVMPHVISSSDTSECNTRRNVGNTAVKRKSLSGHTIIAEATRASGDVMAGQMKEMAEASRDLERSKIEVQLKLFAEQMQYQREKDLRLHQSSIIANENARLAILKQGEVVQCLAQLSSVLTMGLRPPKAGSATDVPQAAHPLHTQHERVPSDGPPTAEKLPKQETSSTTGDKALPDSVLEP